MLRPRVLIPRLLLAALGLAALAAVSARSEEAPPEEAGGAAPPARPDVLPLDAVRPGMRGHGLTVVSGTRLSRFEVEVVDVIRNFLAKQDVILVRCWGEALGDGRIAEGMSGSPIYLEGKIAGALAYTWAWTTEALAGITPIEAMLAEGERAPEGRPSGAEPPTRIRRVPPPDPQGGPSEGTHDLRPIATPVCLGGFSPEGRREAARLLGPLGLRVRAAGGGEVAGAPAGPARLDAPVVPGAAFVMDLVRGDMSAAALGTLTYVDGDRVYALGHEFQGVGETLFPLATAYIYTVVSNQEISFKIGTGIRTVGAVVQDRQAGVVGTLGASAPMVPFTVVLRNEATGRSEEFRFEVCANRIFFQRMMMIAVREAFRKAEATLGSNTKRYRMEVELEGLEEPWAYEDAIAGFDAGPSRILIGLVDRVMIHPTQRAEFRRVHLDVTVENVDRRARIESVAASRDEVRPGEEVDLLVRLRENEGGGVVTHTLRIRVPDGVPPGNFAVEVTGGDNVSADVAAPVDIADLPLLYDAFYKSTELVAVVPTGRVDVDLDGRIVRGLPLSALPRLARSLEGASTAIRPATTKVRRAVPHVVTGGARVVLRVLP